MSDFSREPKDEFTKEDRQRIRYSVRFIEDNNMPLRRVVLIVRAWWVGAAGVFLAVSGTLTKLADKWSGQ